MTALEKEMKWEDVYGGPRHEEEYSRLRAQHRLMKRAMGGELLFCPVDLTKPGLRVLDSATGDGEWLVDLARVVQSRGASNVRLIGADIAPQHFLSASARPANVELVGHSIFDPWPAEFLSSFDAVHQRFVLQWYSEGQAADAVKNLLTCVRPGGWIELHEGNMHDIQEGPQHAVFMRFRDIMVKALQTLGKQTSPVPQLQTWLEQAGAIQVHEVIKEIKVGAAAGNPVDGDLSITVLLESLDGLKLMLCEPGYFSVEEIDQLKTDLEAELRTVGNVYRYHLAWAQKPI